MEKEKIFMMIGLMLILFGFVEVYTKILYNLIKIKGPFEYLEQETLFKQNKDFKLKLQNLNIEFTLPSSLKDKFSADAFKNEVNQGDILTIYVEKKNSKIIEQIAKNNKSYIDQSTWYFIRKLCGYLAVFIGVLFLFKAITNEE